VSDTIVSTWIVKHGWRCSICSCVNEGEQDNCVNCGKPIDSDDPEILPEDMSEANKVTDPKLLERFKAGADLVCEYCNTRQAQMRRHCERCGADLAESKPITVSCPVTEPVQVLPSVKTETPEQSLNVGPARLPPYSAISKQSFWERWRGMIAFVTVVVLIATLCWWLLATHAQRIEVQSVRWTYDVTLLERHLYRGVGWRNHDQWPEFAQETVCQNHQVYGQVQCNPYNCNPHPVSFNCRPFQCRPHNVQVPNGSHSEERTRNTICQRPGSPRCSSRTVCTSNRNRSSTCNRIETCVPTTSSYSCQESYRARVQDYRTEIQYDTCYNTCYTTEYDTCYHQCPVFDDRCEYHYPKWEQIGIQHSEGTTNNIVRPNLNAIGGQACLRHIENEVGLFLRNRNGEFSQCTQDSVNFYVTFGDSGHHRIQPTTATEFARYHVGKPWIVNTNHAGLFEPIREAQ